MDKDELIKQIISEVQEISPHNYGLMTSEGKTIVSTFNKKANKIISKFVYQNSNMPVVAYIQEPLADSKYILYIFKISLEIFLACVSSKDLQEITRKFRLLANKFGYQLFKTFKTRKHIRLPKTQLVREFHDKEPLKAVEKLYLYQELALSRAELKEAMLNHVKSLKHPWPVKKKSSRKMRRSH
ncbi:MAG: hypothetical protein ACTSSI_12270 [Candidatus Helarchaeota archaeon]